MLMETKTCTVCKLTHNIDKFLFRKDNQKYRNECKKCTAQRAKDKNYSKTYRNKKINKKLGIEEQKEDLSENKKRCIKCKEIKDINEYQLRNDTKQYRNQCMRCRQDKVNEYRRTNADYKIRYNQYRKTRRETDEQYYLTEILRSRLRGALKRDNVDKCETTKKLLGCDIQFFKKHIESKFKDDMCWEKRNFEIDHIIPCSSFDLTKDENQKICFHYTNLQPLTKEENSKKSNKIL
jgi:hypothetical protein